MALKHHRSGKIFPLDRFLKMSCCHFVDFIEVFFKPDSGNVLFKRCLAVGVMLLMDDTSSRCDVTELRPVGPCFSPIDPGTCDGVEKRFAFNVNTRKCQMFHYSGCGGNENNFLQRRECMVKCVKKRRGRKHGEELHRFTRSSKSPRK